MLDVIRKQHKEQVTKIFITHDWNIFCLKALFLNYYDDIETPAYLEGMILSPQQKHFLTFKAAHFML